MVKAISVLALAIALCVGGCASNGSHLKTVQTYSDGTTENTELKTHVRTFAWASVEEGAGDASYNWTADGGGNLAVGQQTKNAVADAPIAEIVQALTSLAPLLEAFLPLLEVLNPPEPPAPVIELPNGATIPIP